MSSQVSSTIQWSIIVNDEITETSGQLAPDCFAVDGNYRVITTSISGYGPPTTEFAPAMGSLYIDRSNDDIYVLTKGTSANPTWTQVLTDSVSGFADSTWATDDLTFDGDRVHDMDGHTLTIQSDGSNSIYFINPTTYSFSVGDLSAAANGTTFEVNDQSQYIRLGGPNGVILDVNTANDSVSINNYTLPLTDGTSGQLIVTDGNGNLTFIDANAGDIFPFDNTDLVSGVVTITHSLNSQYVNVFVYDENEQQIIPDQIKYIDVNTISIDLSTFGAIAGVWRAVILTTEAGTGGGVTDHGALTGLSDDDHSQYSLANGTRAFTGRVVGVNPIFPLHLSTKGYVDDEIDDITDVLRKFEYYYNAANQSWASGSVTTLILDTAIRSNSNFSVSSNAVSVVDSGEYSITADVTLFVNNGSVNRTNADSWLQLNGVEVAGTRGKMYLRQNGYGASASIRTVLNLINTDIITIVAQRSNGTAGITQVENGTRLEIRKEFS